MDPRLPRGLVRASLAPLALASLGTILSAQEEAAPPPTAEEPRTSAGYEDLPQLGGPSTVGAQLEEDDRPKEPAFRFTTLREALSPYYDFKARLKEEHGLAFGLDYTGLYQHATESPGEDQAASGIFRLFGTWTLVGREGSSTGSIVFKGENRHAIGTDVPPSGLGFQAGYVGLTASPYNDAGWWLTNLYWQQRWNAGRQSVVAGWVDPTDYLDIYGLINPWTGFMNLALITGGGTIPVPNQGLGAAFGSMLGEHMYVVAGLSDSNSDPGSPGEGFESFFDQREYFKHVELGWTSGQDRVYLDNTHLTFWHADEREEAGVPSGWGLAFSYARFVDDRWMPFLRAGYADDGGALLERSASLGFGRYMAHRRDLLGVGLNWGRPSPDFGQDLDDQWTLEAFYRVQLSENFAITPDVQLISDPALNPTEDFTAVLGVRARLSL